MSKGLNSPAPIVSLGGSPMERKFLYAIAVAAVVVVASVATVYVLTKPSKAPEQKYPVYFTAMSVTSMKGSLASGGIDGFIAWEPFGSDAIIDGVGTALEWSSEIMPHHPCCVVVASTDFLARNIGGGLTGSNITLQFVKAHAETTKWMLDAVSHKDGANYTLLVNLGMEFTLKTQAVVESALDHLTYGYVMDAAFTAGITNFTETFINGDVITEDKLAAGGYSSVADFVDKYVNESFVGSLSSVQPSDTILNPSDPVRIGFLKADIHQLAEYVARNATVGGGAKSMFEKYGVLVTNASTTGGYASGPEEMDKFAAGDVDIGYLGCAPAIQKHLNAQVHTVIVAQANSEGSAIVVKADSGITSIDGLQNMTIAVPATGSIQYVLLKAAVENAGLVLELKT
jgi:sulfonate transport system substrate-binding protein